MDKFAPARKSVDWRVEVRPDVRYVYMPDPHRMCQEIALAIRRRVEECGAITVECDSVCMHCERDPEPDWRTGEPACCDTAIKEYDEFVAHCKTVEGEADDE